MNSGKLLFIDEDFASIRYYLSELSDEKFDVNHVRTTDGALAAIKTENDQYQLIVLDSAMPPGKVYEKLPTDSGTATGGLLFADIRKQSNAPIIILTNFNSLEWIQKAEATQNVRVLKKLDTLPRELVACVKEMIKESLRR